MLEKGALMPSVLVTDRDLALISSIGVVFPNAHRIICIWHINKNVVKKCSPFLGAEWTNFNRSWHKVYMSSDTGSFEHEWKLLVDKYKSYPKVIEYLWSTWLLPYSDLFVYAWTNNYMHLGCRSSQRVESAHSRLKKYLGDTMSSIDTSVEKIDKMLILEFGDIKASFERARIMRCHNFNDHLYENLLGCVSLEALHLISDELKKIDGQYLDNCSCSFKFIYGLPCKHRLLFFQSQFFSIPLDEIHCHWKRKMDPTMRYHMLDKMIDMVDPSNCKFQEPPYNTKNKGRPSKKEQSQPRMRSCFEPTNNRTRNPTKRVNDPYIKQMPSAYWIHVSHTIDVMGDGNCGYRAIAPQVGYNTEDGWKQVRADLYYEIEKNMDFYDHIFRERGAADKMMRALNFFGSPAPQWSWMDIMCGAVIATRYNVVLHAFTSRSGSCLTHLPFRSAPIPFQQRQHIAIALVNDNHFVQVFLNDDYPVPPIALLWWENVSEDCKEWADPYVERIQSWFALMAI
ncbi:hypothetical protein OROMI_017457 [Orobanche minor]